MHMKSTFRDLAWALRALLVLLISFLFLVPPGLKGQMLSTQQMNSRTGPDEFDTEVFTGGQIGGRLMGFGYKLLAMRCVSGQVIVGVNMRRGDVIDYLQISCARPSCTNGSCTWSSSQPGMSAGNPGGGDAHPAMMCQSNEIVTGIRGRVLAFTAPVAGRRTGFDYAADLEIECSQMAAAAVSGPSGQRFYPVNPNTGVWHHPEGGFEYATPEVPSNAIQDSITGPISCRGRGYGASSISVGIANFLGSANYPVVQAISLFCPRIAPTISTDFRVMTASDPMASNGNYVGTQGYFPGTQSSSMIGSNCHGFVGEMGINTPGSNVCGNGLLVKNSDALPAGTPLQLGDVVVVYGRAAGLLPLQLHSAIYIGCNYYLQRNGNSEIQVSDQNWINTFPGAREIYYIRPTGSLATYQAELAQLKQRFNSSEGPTPTAQNKINAIMNCFP